MCIRDRPLIGVVSAYSEIVPGMVMAAVRMDVPAVVCSGGPMLAGTYGGEEVSLRCV